MKRGLVPAVLAAVLLAIALRPSRMPAPERLRPPRLLEGPKTPLFVDVPEGVRPSRSPLASTALEEQEREYAEPDGPVYRALRFLMASQNQDGSWGRGVAVLDGHPVGSTGLTALAVLAFFESGYSHLSKDVYGGWTTGDAVRRGLDLLQKRLKGDGLFVVDGDPILEQALGALAFLEAYGMTGSRAFQDPAARSLESLLYAQSGTGSWGTQARTDWAAEAIQSARISGLPMDPARRALLAWNLERRAGAEPDEVAALQRVRLREGGHPQVTRWVEEVRARRGPITVGEFPALYFQARLMNAAPLRRDSAWSDWRRSFVSAHDALQEPDGGWPGADSGARALSTSLATMNLAWHYVYRPAVFGHPER